MADMTQPIKPIVVAQKEVQEQLVTIINTTIQETNMPFFILAPILKELYEEVSHKAEAEYKQASEQYKQAIAAYQMSLAAEEPKSEN